MQGKLEIKFPSQGWKQFLTARQEILDKYDRAREQARSHEVETYHGNVAEAEFRNWLNGTYDPSRLSSFYGIGSTSGELDRHP